MHKAYINAAQYPFVYYSSTETDGVQQIKEEPALDKEAGIMPLWGHGLAININKRRRRDSQSWLHYRVVKE